MKRVATWKAIVLGAAMTGLAMGGTGAAPADTRTASNQHAGVSATVLASTDYGRGTTRSDNSPGSAGGLS